VPPASLLQLDSYSHVTEKNVSAMVPRFAPSV